MPSKPQRGQLATELKFQAKELLILSAWSGLLAGVVEATGMLVFQRLGLFGGLDEVD